MLASRNISKTQTAIQLIKDSRNTDRKIESVSFVEKSKKELSSLDILRLNAGVVRFCFKQTKDGYEEVYTTQWIPADAEVK
jgi:hypothetical protein